MIGQYVSRILYGFEGRISRVQYLIGVLIMAAIFLALLMLSLAIADALSVDLGVRRIIVVITVIAVMTIPLLALMVKRLHDRDKSGWWVLPFYFVPYWLRKLSAEVPEDSAIWGLLIASATLLSIWALLEFFLLAGTNGANRYGEGPIKIAPQQLQSDVT